MRQHRLLYTYLVQAPNLTIPRLGDNATHENQLNKWMTSSDMASVYCEQSS